MVDWNDRYLENDTPWNLDGAAPAFEHLAQSGWVLNGTLTTLSPSAKLWVPGCGLGHDAAVFGQHGFDVLGSDTAPLAIVSATDRYGQWAQFALQDGLNPPESLHGQFDAVIEHTFFCAIDPALREAYVRAVADVLKPGGRLFGLFWLHGQPGGPPYDTSKIELERLFSEDFTWLGFAPNPWPVASRKPQEWLLVLEKK